MASENLVKKFYPIWNESEIGMKLMERGSEGGIKDISGGKDKSRTCLLYTSDAADDVSWV